MYSPDEEKSQDGGKIASRVIHKCNVEYHSAHRNSINVITKVMWALIRGIKFYRELSPRHSD